MTEVNVTEVMRVLGKLEGGQEAILNLLSKQDERLNNHGERIEKLERGRAWLIGAGAALGWVLQYVTIPFTVKGL